jgi:molybdopterin molybdotransferase
VLATGDELVEPWVPSGPAQVRNSNAPMLVSALRAAGAEPEYIGIAKDNPASLRSLLKKGLSADIMLVSGGVSVGTRDLVGMELKNVGVEPVFTRVAVKPGKPLFFGRKGGTVVFGLPGNPASSLVAFELFVRPALCKMRGFGENPPQFRSGELKSSIAAKRDRLTFLPATFERSPSGAVVELLKWAGSGDIKAMAHANCLVAIPPGKAPIPAGTRVDFVTFQWAADCS